MKLSGSPQRDSQTNGQPDDSPDGILDGIHLRDRFLQLAQQAAISDNRLVLAVAAQMVDLLSVAEMLASDAGMRSRADDIHAFCRDSVLPLLSDESSGTEHAPELGSCANQKFGELLSLLSPEEKCGHMLMQSHDDASQTEWNVAAEYSDAIDDAAERHITDDAGNSTTEVLTTSIDMASMLQMLRSATDHTDTPGHPPVSQNARDKLQTAQVVPALPRPPALAESIDDPEMISAYADDAQQCLSEMEAALLEVDGGRVSDEGRRNFCRQLHTLKGASGTVGLSHMAGYLHQVESWIESSADGEIRIDDLLECVDTVRRQLAGIGIIIDEYDSGTESDPVTSQGCAGTSVAGRQVAPVVAERAGDRAVARSMPAPTDTSVPELVTATDDDAAPSASKVQGLSTSPSDATSGTASVRSGPFLAGSGTPSTVARSETDGFVRVEAAKLERLMDLLAELVILRNQRDVHVKALQNVHSELNLCALRARTLTDSVDLVDRTDTCGDRRSATGTERQAANARLLARSLHEIAHDTAALSRSLQDVYEPLASDNASVSHLIGQFRQELMELRRVPVSGLFQRLQRSIRDAARAEGKRVDIVVAGQGARAERSVQQRLFEPLLHLVRNAVSHGIQVPEDRVQKGKPAAGCITLSAWSNAASLCIEVQDDGAGLDETALEARGRQLGLLSPGEPVTSAQVRQLIFHPGFSTRTAVSEISGRGVGMDVVATWIRRLRGRLDVESAPGQGTTFRLQIPLRSAVEHAMLVRAGSQLFALPMHSVSGTADDREGFASACTTAAQPRSISLQQLLNLPDLPSDRHSFIKLRRNQMSSSSTSLQGDGIVLAVDAITGVEEVVVRSLPPLLQRNELFAGVTLSGHAEIVLLLDSERLIELGHQHHSDATVTSESLKNHVPAARSLQIDAHTHPAGQNCLLIVDDSVVVRRTLKKKLNALGIPTLEAENGHAALKFLKTGRVTGVVTDIDMPGMNGIELMQELRQQKLVPRIPVLVLSSRDQESLPVELRKLQPQAVLSKPVTDSTIRQMLHTLQSCWQHNRQPAAEENPHTSPAGRPAEMTSVATSARGQK